MKDEPKGLSRSGQLRAVESDPRGDDRGGSDDVRESALNALLAWNAARQEVNRLRAERASHRCTEMCAGDYEGGDMGQGPCWQEGAAEEDMCAECVAREKFTRPIEHAVRTASELRQKMQRQAVRLQRRVALSVVSAVPRDEKDQDHARLAPSERVSGADPRIDDRIVLGLNVDMLDVDRLRDWARLIDEYGPSISAWASPDFVVSKLRDIADRLEKEIRERV